jgi:hypothetical protein
VLSKGNHLGKPSHGRVSADPVALNQSHPGRTGAKIAIFHFKQSKFEHFRDSLPEETKTRISGYTALCFSKHGEKIECNSEENKGTQHSWRP